MAWVADPTSVVGRRVAAALVDGVLVAVLAVAGFTADLEYRTRDDIVAAGFSGVADYCDEYMDVFDDEVCVPWIDDRALFGAPGGWTFLGWFGTAVALFVLLQGLTGFTPGKLATGIRTVKEDGSRPGVGRAFVRWVLWIVDGLPFLALVGFITALTTTGHRRVGDMVAKTFVVRREAAGRPVLVAGVTAPPGAAPGAIPAPPPGTGPHWDEARGTYVQWDPAAGAWMAWDEAARRWDPIPGQAPAPPPPPPSTSAPPPPPPTGGERSGDDPPPPPPP